MALFFDEDNVKCPKCGNALMICQNAGFVTVNKGECEFLPYCTIYRCAECGEKVQVIEKR
jgi:DNA-directed RNA polymerase subunit RPC12/RpoP